MALDFPNSPTVGSTFTSAGATWQWDGSKWIPATAIGAVRYDTSQSLTTPQMGVALQNIGAVYARLALVNGKIVESHASNAATFAIKTTAGNDPSATDPVMVVFTDGSILALTAALSLVIPSSATLGTSSATPFRIWFCIFNDAGTPRLGVRLCSSAPSALSGQVFGIPRSHSSTAISGSATAVGVTYTGAAVTSKPSVIVANAEYDTGLTTAGTWAASPSRINLQGAGMHKPGDVLQIISEQGQPIFSTSSTSMVESTATRISMTPTSLFNLLNYNVFSYHTVTNIASSNNNCIVRVGINGTFQNVTEGRISAQSAAGGLGAMASYGCVLLIMPFSIAAQTFSVYIAGTFGSVSLTMYSTQITEYVG